MKQIYNFSGGPSCLPKSVLEEISSELTNYKGLGFSILEMSHRTKEFEIILQQAIEDVKTLLNINNDQYEVLFLQGGATQFFAEVPINMMKSHNAGYIDNGIWSTKAIKEAQKYGSVKILASSQDDNYCSTPNCENIDCDNLDYVYLCENETIYGTKFKKLPFTGNTPIVADVSSCFFSEPVDISKYGVMFGGVQKNLGTAGLVLAIIRKDLLSNNLSDKCPTMFDWKLMANKNSCYNTPPVFAIYVCSKILRWIIGKGGLDAMGKINEEKAKILYDCVDSSSIFANNVKKSDRSLMNVVFSSGDAKVDSEFIEQASAFGLINLKGHRAVGGIRASIYNAMEKCGVEALVNCIEHFDDTHKKYRKHD